LNHFNYFSDIEAAFVRRRGKVLLLSPLDWTLIESWQKRGIPEHIVIRSIDKIFDDIAKDPKRNPNIKSIAYCSDEVERQYREWTASQAGAGRETGGPGEGAEEGAGEYEPEEKTEVLRHLKKLIETLEAPAKRNERNSALKTVLSNTVAELKKLVSGIEQRAGFDGEKIEQNLAALESAVDKVLLEEAGGEEAAKAQKEVSDHLSQYAGKMQQDIYDKTYELMIVKKLREKAGIPAFSLFYL
jgi:cytochrome c556